MRPEFTSIEENKMDSDQLASRKPAALGHHCFQNRIYLGFAYEGLNILLYDFYSDCYQV